ncbi:MAG: response regulator, partial [Leptolyngbyaceae cyanobacterium bins.59]|nr:response regulator [Leptolyngbyaceae cyanobacterium bins.59]
LAPFASPPAASLILIADDHVAVRTLLRQMMRQEGYRVIQATNGEECLRAYQLFHPDLVLLDAIMPEMDGFECCARMTGKAVDRSQPINATSESINRNPPILIITSLEDEESIDKAFAVGATDYIPKPIHSQVLKHRVRHLINVNRAAYLLQQQQEQEQRNLQRFNAELERTVQSRTTQLLQSLEFEATLRRITDKVRDSLNESQILQTAVQELTEVLHLVSCRTAIYDLAQGISTIQYEYCASEQRDCLLPASGAIVEMLQAPEVYLQLLNGQHFQFCPLPSNPDLPHYTVLVCPLVDDQAVLGDLWLTHQVDYRFSEMEIRLVQQVANQCAIAIRQARLYQTAQANIADLERLNHLKDDFLSTVSHELRSPVTNMRMAIQMLENCLQGGQHCESMPTLPPPSRIPTYLQILKTECDREMHLIEDLLDLQRLESQAQPLCLETLDLYLWLPAIVEPFQHRVQERNQHLSIHLEPNLPHLVSDPTNLRRILCELLHNACKYTPPTGTIQVESGIQADQLQIRIINTGIEIPPHELPRIFDRFYRVPSGDPWKQGGTGLGLTLVNRLVNHLGGTIQVQSGAGRTCFTIELSFSQN